MKKKKESDRFAKWFGMENPVYSALPCVYSMQFNGWRLSFFIHNTLYVSIFYL